MKLTIAIIFAATTALTASMASASMRCTTTGNVTRCVDWDTNTTTRCTTTGNVTRCTTY